MKQYNLGICISFFICTALSGQTDTTYRYYFDKGQEYYDTLAYQKANRMFRAAEISTKDLKEQRDALYKVIMSDSAYVVALTDAERRAKAARDSALIDRDKAFTASQNAKRSQRFSDAVYWASVASQEIEKDEYSAHDQMDSVAMQLALYAVKKIKEDNRGFIAEIDGVFGRAVYRACREIDVDGHHDAITDIQFSIDGFSVTQAGDSSVSFRKNNELYRLLKHKNFILGMQVCSTGKFVLTWTRGENHNVTIWDVGEKGQLKYEYPYAITNRINRVLYSKRHDLVCIAVYKGPLIFWNPSNNLKIELQVGSTWVRDVVFSPDTTLILSRGADGTLGVWDLEGNIIASFMSHDKYVYGAHFSPDGTQILTHSADQSSRIWDVSGTLLTSLEAHQNPVHHAKFSEDGNYILTLSLGNDVCIWDRDGQLKRHILPLLAGETNNKSAVLSIRRAHFLADSKSFLTISDSIMQRVHIDGFVMKNFDHGGLIHDVDLSSDGKFALSFGYDNVVKVWNLFGDPDQGNGELLMEMALEGDARVTFAKFTPDNTKVLVGMSDGAVQIVPMPHDIMRKLELNPVRISPDYLATKNIRLD